MSIKRIKNAGNFLVIYLQRELRKLRGLPVIHVIGDSHSLLFQSPLFHIHYIGPATAFNLKSDTSSTKSKQKIYSILSSLPQNSIVLFVFGEIDCRIHIYDKSIKGKISISKSIQHTIASYDEFISTVKKGFPSLIFAVFNIVPPGEQNNIYHIKNYASYLQRLSITQEVNIFINDFCKKNDIVFIDIFNRLIDQKKRIQKYIFDDVHYNSKIVPFVIQALQEENIL